MTAPIRGLTLIRPWPLSIHGYVEFLSEAQVPRYVQAPKRIENRGWHPYLGLAGNCFLALHSGQKFDHDAVTWLAQRGWRCTVDSLNRVQDAITGVAFLERDFGPCDRGCSNCKLSHRGDQLDADPFYMGGVGWVLSSVVPLINPVPCKGNRGLWKLKPETEQALRLAYLESLHVVGSQLESGRRWIEPEKLPALSAGEINATRPTSPADCDIMNQERPQTFMNMEQLTEAALEAKGEEPDDMTCQVCGYGIEDHPSYQKANAA